MVCFTSWKEAIAYLRVGGGDLEVSLSYDSREDLSYAPGMGDLRRAWADQAGRVHIELLGVGSLPSLLQAVHHFWVKVGLVRKLLDLPRVLAVLWCDSDATPVPMDPGLSPGKTTRRLHRSREPWQHCYPSLETLWDTFGPATMPQGGRTFL